MQIRIKETEIKVNRGIYSFLEKKIKALKKFLPDIPELIIEVELGLTTRHHQKGNIYRAEIQIPMPRKRIFRAVSEKENLRSAIIEAQKEMEAQLIKRKDTFIAKRKKVS
ncbi:MAG: ribosome-associated translation inhibitor RaiA [Candidatus Paceibacterota bacterium]|jgi:ribosomal subunit interface protein|nr:ribosome-associated translation inhibitor RaiA [Candidatus Paceibacterota bacterium]MDD5555487.1 ribosome-associated translation inhibitor RaiA [Candidatus Paceibacterota bacterium]